MTDAELTIIIRKVIADLPATERHDLSAHISSAVLAALPPAGGGRAVIVEECAKCVPTNWCDELLTGPNAPKHPLDNRGVEQLLRGIQDRIRAIPPAPQRTGE